MPDEPIPISEAPPAEALQFRRAEPIGATSPQRCVVCPACAERIQQGQQAPPAYSFPRALLFGAAAGLAGCAIYATVAIATGMEIGLIAILVITTSYIPVIIWEVAHKSKIESPQTLDNGAASNQAPAAQKPMPLGSLILYLLAVCAAEPFLSLTSGFSGLITLFIIFIGLRQAWTLTGRSEILLMGPYPTEGGSA